MIRHALPLIVAVIGVAASPTLAAPPARTPAPDARIRTVDYDPARVVRIVGVARTATQIVFAADETVQHVALGDSGAWDVAADRNVLFLKPKPKVRRPATDLIVTTEGPAGGRSYVFDLVDGAGSGDRAFVLRFRYPAAAAAQAHAALSAAEATVARRVTALKLERGAVEGPRNMAYSEQGPADLQPSEVSDNGRFTVLRFPGAQPLPAIYTVGPDGAEALAAFDVRGEFVVVHEVARGLRLRRNREVLCITNDAYRSAGTPTGTLTSAKDVARTEQGSRP